MDTENVSSELRDLRKLLAEKYFYKSDFFGDRTKWLTVGCNSSSYSYNALCFEVYEGAPFLLAVVNEAKGDTAVRDGAVKFALATETIGTLVLYDPQVKELEVLKRRFRDEQFELVPDLEYYYSISAGGELPIIYEQMTGGKTEENFSTVSLNPISDRLEDLFFEMHSEMRDVDGLHSDAALEELCKLLYLKFFLEEQAEKLPVSPIKSQNFGTAEEYAACLRALYREASNYDIRVFQLRIPEYRRSRGVFDTPIFLSTAALVKSFQIVEDLALCTSNTDVKGRAFQKVLNKSMRAGMGQYFTPSQVCSLIVAIMQPTQSDLILDPFCGSGHFLTKALAYVRENVDNDSKGFHEFAFGKLHGIEKSDRMTRVAMTDMRLHGDGHSNIRCTDALLDFRNYPDLDASSFDLVMTNPPFGSILGAQAFSALAAFELAQGRKKVPLEIIGLERCVEFLRPGGRLGIVLPESIFSADSCKYVRDWLGKHVVPRVIIDLPPETFSPYGANVRSGILFARKRRKGERISGEEKVCMIRLDNIGYDASGRPKPGSEIDEVVTYATTFLEKEGW
ncbi:MAG: SAM-dependent DNA methyltransferase [Lentisphaerae bacterium]|nr:SAM-dependent DNA methyltransferase [Lentisphaerota bacterium]